MVLCFGIGCTLSASISSLDGSTGSDLFGKLSINVPPFEVQENANTNIIILLNDKAPNKINLTWEITGDSSATSFHEVSGSIQINENAETAMLQIKPVNDLVYSGTKTFSLKLSSDSKVINFGSGNQYKVFDFNLIDDELKPSLDFTSALQTILESSGSTTVRAQLSTALGHDLTFTYIVSGTATSLTDHSLINGSATISAGMTYVDIPVTVINDSAIEGTETIIITISGFASNDANMGTISVHTISITDDDSLAPLVITPKVNTLVSGDTLVYSVTGGLAPYNFSLVADTTGSGLTVLSTSSTTFQAGNTPGSVMVRVVDSVGSTSTATVEIVSLSGLAQVSSNFKFWLKADSLALANNSLVSSWNDVSGGGWNATQSTDANKPVFKSNIINNKPVIRFDGSGTYLTTSLYPATGNESRTFATVIANGDADLGTSQHVFTMGDTFLYGSTYALTFQSPFPETTKGLGIGSHYHSQAYSFPAYSTTSSLASKVGPNSERMVILQKFDGTTDKIYINGELVGSRDITLTTHYTSLTFALRVGAKWMGDSHFKGDIAEIIGYGETLSDANQKKLECYLASKYAIALKNRADCTAGPLKLSPLLGVKKPLMLGASQSHTFQAQGGHPAYTYSIDSGLGSINSTTGVYTASGTPGSVVIKVMDKLGSTDTYNLVVIPDVLPLAWFKAESLATKYNDGDKVTLWENEVGSGFDLRQVSQLAPIFKTNILNSKPVVRYPNGEPLVSALNPADGSKARTILAVVVNSDTWTLAGFNQYILGYGNSSFSSSLYGLCSRTDNDDIWSVLFQATTQLSSVVASTQATIVSTKYDGNSNNIYINGAISGTSVVSLNTQIDSNSHGLVVGAAYIGDIAEVLVYDKELSDVERASVENYLKAKYNIP